MLFNKPKCQKLACLLFCTICLLVAACGGEAIKQANSVPKEPDYQLYIKNLDLSKPVLAGPQTATIQVTNSGTTPLVGALAYPFYGDSKIFPDTFSLPTILPGASRDIAIHINVQSPSSQSFWKIVYIIVAPIQNPAKSNQTLYVMPVGGAFEISFTSTVDQSQGQNLTALPDTYKAAANPSNVPTTGYCLNAAADDKAPGTYPDGTHVKNGETIDKHWYTTACGDTPSNLVGVAIWGDFVYDGHGMDIKDPANFHTLVTITTPSYKNGGAIQTFTYAQKIAVGNKEYIQPFGPSFWLFVTVV